MGEDGDDDPTYCPKNTRENKSCQRRTIKEADDNNNNKSNNNFNRIRNLNHNDNNNNDSNSPDDLSMMAPRKPGVGVVQRFGLAEQPALHQRKAYEYENRYIK